MTPLTQPQDSNVGITMPNILIRSGPPTRASMTTDGGFLEAWAQGYNVGSLIILILIVFCNYRAGIWLHKLILLELILALFHGTFIFVPDPAYGWYLSATATLLFLSYFLHNLISWLKIRPFLLPRGSRIFIVTLLLAQPFWVAEAWSNFSYFNSLGSEANISMRPWEAALRDPWWIFTTWWLVNAIKGTYGFGVRELCVVNRRFAVLLLCMFLSIVFLLTDVVVSAARVTATSGINPFWRLALVFKCASDTVFLDDFKSVLDAIVLRKLSETGGMYARGITREETLQESISRDWRKRSDEEDILRRTIRCDPGMIEDETSPRAFRHSMPNTSTPYFGPTVSRLSIDDSGREYRTSTPWTRWNNPFKFTASHLQTSLRHFSTPSTSTPSQMRVHIQKSTTVHVDQNQATETPLLPLNRQSDSSSDSRLYLNAHQNNCNTTALSYDSRMAVPDLAQPQRAVYQDDASHRNIRRKSWYQNRHRSEDASSGVGINVNRSSRSLITYVNGEIV